MVIFILLEQHGLGNSSRLLRIHKFLHKSQAKVKSCSWALGGDELAILHHFLILVGVLASIKTVLQSRIAGHLFALSYAMGGEGDSRGCTDCSNNSPSFLLVSE